MDSAVLAIAEHLEDACPDVREATICALRALDSTECSILIAALVKRINHADANIRLASVKALALVVEPGNAIALDAITRLLDDDDAGVRYATVEAMGRIARPGSMTDLAVHAIAQRMTSSADPGDAPYFDYGGYDAQEYFNQGTCNDLAWHAAAELNARQAAMHGMGHRSHSLPDASLPSAPLEKSTASRPWTSETLSIDELRTMDTMIISTKDLDRSSMMYTNEEINGLETANVNEGETADVWWSALEAMSRISVPDSQNTMGAIIERLQLESFSGPQPAAAAARQEPFSGSGGVPRRDQHADDMPTLLENSGARTPPDTLRGIAKQSSLNRSMSRSTSMSLLKAMDTIQEEEDANFERERLGLRNFERERLGLLYR